ncbi:MAG: DUF2851 family protein [Pontiellaceae bacterium]|nr:DUF2851 family protein [Pontiellaceae bacterium]MBN2785949.1 DUF2851 family protein [Pontiellaceae bacterium]
MKEYFPRSAFYRSDGHSGRIQEYASPFTVFPYRERHLQCLWADARHRPVGLKTTEGEPVEVEHPGDWNLEAGPDFLNAVLRIGKERRRVSGDLEIHIHAGSWNLHGHANDPRYAHVRFHIVYFQGQEIPGLAQIPLQQILKADPLFSFENIDPAAYPYSVPSGTFPLKELHPDRKIQLLESAGEERLRLKAERLTLALQSKETEQVLWEELMTALGYKQNKTVFRKLATILPQSRLIALCENHDEAYAILLGISGLLPRDVPPHWPSESRHFIRHLWDIWWRQSEDLKESGMDRSEWNLAGIRPANHPVRRMMAAACYAFTMQGLIRDETLLLNLPDTFWNTHISWKNSCRPTALVGTSRADAIITNLLIPFRAAIGDPGFDLKALPPEPMNRIIRQTAHALFGPDHTPKVYQSALARQGLIQIFHDFLITRRLDELKIAIDDGRTYVAD